MSFRPLIPRVFPVIAAVLAGLSAAETGLSQEKETLAEIPDKLFQIQDSQGFFWQASGNGALTSGETQYLQSGLNLIVAGEAFNPTRAAVRAPGEGVETVDVEFSESRDGISILRNLWFDAERAGVRVFDTITNTANVAQTVAVELRTTYPFGWQSLHDLEGELLSNEPTLTLGEQDMGLVVRFSPSEGRHDTVLLATSESGGEKPNLKASANSRELTLSYDLILKAGESKSLLHWVLQRNVPEISESGADIAGVTQRGRLIRPGVEATNLQNTANFGPGSFPDETVAPAQLRSLVALNALTDRIGFHRRSDDLLWINSTNQISGKVNRDASITIDAAHVGEKSISISDVAAIQGGGGTGRIPRVFLRDGQVFVGKTSAEGLGSLTGGEGDPLDLDQINLLLLGTGTQDGAAPEGTEFFLQLKDGTVLASTAGAEAGLNVATSWGTETPTFREVTELEFLTAPSPRWRLVSESGSRFSGFLMGEPLELKLARGGETTVAPVAIQKMWRPAMMKSSISRSSDAWFDFEEVPEGLADGEVFLLEGNDLIAGSLGDDYLVLNQGGSSLKIAADRIASVSRHFETGTNDGNRFRVLLDNGDRLDGSFEGPYFAIERGDTELTLPIVRLIAYRKAAPRE